MSAQTLELTGHCQKCHDTFTVECIPVRKGGEHPNMRYFRPILTKWLTYSEHRFYHKPDVCNGVVHLHGNPRLAGFTNE